jgi:hypothetical protein
VGVDLEGNMGLGRKLAAAAVGAVVLWLAPNAIAADQLLETVNVDPANTAVTTGPVQLKQGTEYQLQISGTFTLANGFGQSFDEDALYCFGDMGFVTPQCTPTPQRFGDFYIGSGSSSLKNIDEYQEPGGGGPQIGYGITHRYNVNFYPPANGPLIAGGTLAQSQCKSGPNPCTTTISGGPITIQIYGPAATPPPPPPQCSNPTKCRPVQIPTVSAPGVTQTIAKPPPGIAAVGLLANYGGANQITEGIGGLSKDDLTVLEGAKTQCYVEFTRNVILEAGILHDDLEAAANRKLRPPAGLTLQEAEKAQAEFEKEFSGLFVPLLSLDIKAELDQCVAAVEAVEVLGAAGKLAGDTAGAASASSASASCQMTPVTLSVTGSGKKARVKSFKIGNPNDKHRSLNVSCTSAPGGVAASIATRSKGPLSGVLGSTISFAVVRSKTDPPGGTLGVAYTTPSTSPPPPPPPSPTFTGTWNTSFGSMQLTQTGNQVTGTYADCPNNGATISGTVTGTALDGTWTEPCHNAQGRIHFVLSADGKSFTGLWGVGSATPTGAWNGTRAP